MLSKILVSMKLIIFPKELGRSYEGLIGNARQHIVPSICLNLTLHVMPVTFLCASQYLVCHIHIRSAHFTTYSTILHFMFYLFYLFMRI